MFRFFTVLFFLFISLCSADVQGEAEFILRSAEKALKTKYSPDVFSIRHIGFHVSLSDNADSNLSDAAGAYGSVLTDKVTSAIRANLAGTGRDNHYLVDVLLQWDLTAAKNVLASRSAVPELLMIYRTYNLKNDGDLRTLNLSNNSGRQMLENLLRSGRELEDEIPRSFLLERLSDLPEKSDLLNALLSNDAQSLTKALDNNRQALFDYRLSELNRLIKQAKDSEAAGRFSDALRYALQARDQELDLRTMGSLFIPFMTGRQRFHADMTIGNLRDFVRDLDAKVSKERQKKLQQDLAVYYLGLASNELGNRNYTVMYSYIDKIRNDCRLSDLAVQIRDGSFQLDGKSLSELKALVPGGLSEQEGESGQEQKTVDGIEFVFIGPGEFNMGESYDARKVKISNGFWMGKYEVTQGQWKAIMGNNPSLFKEGDNYPVESVSWDDVQEFIKKLNKKVCDKEFDSEQVWQANLKKGNKEADGCYRLPTEAEWEYAARAGTSTKYSWGDNQGCPIKFFLSVYCVKTCMVPIRHFFSIV